MKNLCFALALAALTGCATAPVEHKPSEKVGILDNYLNAWNNHDAARAANFFTDDVEYFDASVGEAQRGKDNARIHVVEAFLKAVPDAVWQRDPAEPIVGGEGLAFSWIFSGTNTGDWSDGTKATGKKFSVRGASLIRFRNGKIAYQADYYDAYSLFKQLGLVQ
jgi:steroid delta-isomerase-like uncharacterized protein